MIFELKKQCIKLAATLIALLIITDMVILLNIPFLREFMAFIYFTIVPGILILLILKLNRLEFLKKVVLAVGLSISFIMFMGLLLNSTYPFLLKPLSLAPVLILFNVLLIIMTFAACYRNKGDFALGEFLNLRINLKSKLTSMLIFPMIFPFMAIFGTYLMNITQNNIILLLMLFLIPLYITILVFLKKRIHSITYPVTLGMIGLSLLLMHSLTSFHVIGRDVQFEFHFFNLVLNNAHWSPYGDIVGKNAYNSCISVTILPAIYKLFSNLNNEYVFKLYFAIIGIILPLILYNIFKRYFSPQNAFFASLIFVFQPYFIMFLGLVRQEIAFIFFFLAILVYNENNMGENIKKLLFLIFIFSMIISHYATAYLAFIILIPILLIPFIQSLIKDRKNIKFTNFDLIIAILIFTLIWYIFVAHAQYIAASDTINLSSASITSGHYNIGGQKESKVLAIFGIGLKSIPNAISAIVNDIIIFIIGLGLLNIIYNYKSYKKRINNSFLWGMLLSPFILILPLILPNLSIIYDIERLFLQLIVFLAPLFIIGITYITKKSNKENIKPFVILILIISLFSCSTYLTYHFDGIPYSPYYESQGSLRDEYYIYDQELISAEWIKNNSLHNTSVLTDSIGPSRLLLANNNYYNINTNRSSNYYIYLGYANVKKGIIYTQPEYPEKLESYPNLLINKSKIFDDGGSQIYYALNLKIKVKKITLKEE